MQLTHLQTCIFREGRVVAETAISACVRLFVCVWNEVNQDPRAQSFVARKMTALVSFRQGSWARCLSVAL